MSKAPLLANTTAFLSRIMLAPRCCIDGLQDRAQRLGHRSAAPSCKPPWIGCFLALGGGLQAGFLGLEGIDLLLLGVGRQDGDLLLQRLAFGLQRLAAAPAMSALAWLA